MGHTIKIFDTAEELAQHFASCLVSRFMETPGDRNFSWVLSGGTTPQYVFREIASTCRETIDWNRVYLFWGDERCVGPENIESNYNMAREYLLDRVPAPLCNIFRIHGEADPSPEADRYSMQLRRHVAAHVGIPRVDFLMLGVGEDGHTASIFPATIHLFNSDKLFEATEHPHTKQKRITATGGLINQAKTVVFVATGEAKSSNVARIIHRLPGWEELPAARVCPENGEVIWLLDKSASGKLR
jgi:6-phosphogluconolactonase